MNEIKKIFKRAKFKGLTLIELLLVIAIISILSGMVVASIGDAPAQSRDAKRVADLANIQMALELYYDTNDEYPKHDGVIPNPSPSEEVLASTTGTTGHDLIDGNYITTLPVDPTNNTTYKYWYCSTTTGDKYALKAKLETDSSSLDSDYDTDWPATGICNCDASDAAASGPYTYCIRN